MDFLASCPSLHVLEVELSHLRVAVALDRVQGLREISLTENYRFHPAGHILVQTYDNLAKLLALRAASQIKKLSVVRTSLHKIFELHTLEPLGLEDLRMSQSFIKLDPLTIPHLRNLTCLHLLNMKTPSHLRKENLNASEDTSSTGSEQLERAEEDRIGSNMNDFWMVLHGAGVCLKEIHVDSINDGLLVYLSGYTGLTKLVVNSDSSPSANLFFAEPLASHVETLEELHVLAGFEDLWCFGKHNVLAFSRLKGLKVLSVCVSEVDLSIHQSFIKFCETRTARNRPGIVVSSHE